MACWWTRNVRHKSPTTDQLHDTILLSCKGKHDSINSIIKAHAFKRPMCSCSPTMPREWPPSSVIIFFEHFFFSVPLRVVFFAPPLVGRSPYACCLPRLSAPRRHEKAQAYRKGPKDETLMHVLQHTTNDVCQPSQWGHPAFVRTAPAGMWLYFRSVRAKRQLF